LRERLEVVRTYSDPLIGMYRRKARQIDAAR